MTDEEPLTRRAAREAADALKKSKPGSRSAAVGAETAQTEVLGSTGSETVMQNTAMSGTAMPGTAKPKAASRWKGFNDLVAKHPNAWMFSALGVIFLLMGTGAVFAGVVVGSNDAIAAAPSQSPTQRPPRPAPSEQALASALRTCSIAPLIVDPRLMTFAGSVINAGTGEVLFDRAAAVGAPPASVLKVLTAAAAVTTIGPDYQLSTRVFEGSAPGSIVLVGGGDPTLSALPAGVESFYTGAPKIDDLAAQTIANWEARHPTEDITSVILDATYWNPADKWDPSWNRSDQTDGYQSEVTALMVDGDRSNPQRGTSPRGTDPIGTAGAAFVDALDLGHPVTVSTGSVLAGKALLAEVKSQPIKVLIGQMLLTSDNSLGEMIARVVSKESGGGGSAASLQTVISSALTQFGLTTTGLVIKDGSGLSENNLVPPLFVSQLMAKVNAGAQSLDVILVALPVAGETGSLANRFNGDNAIAQGKVLAKTGWVNSSRTLAGIVTAADGTVLSFAFYALGPVEENATTALDTVATGVYTCGNNLSNN